MEILEQKINIEHDNLAHANYIYTMIPDYKEPITEDGYYISKVKLKNGKVYDIYIMSNSKSTPLSDLSSEIEPRIGGMDKYTLKEYFINGNGKQLIFASQAYFRIVNKEEPEEIKIIFTDYLECLEYLESVEK